MKTKSLNLPSSKLPLVVAFAFVQSANAMVINYQVTLAGSASPESTLFGPDLHMAGSERWNIDQWVSTSPTVTDMIDIAGASTGVGITQNGFNGVDDWNIGAALTMIHRSASAFNSGPGNAASFTITGLTIGASYDLYIASAHTSNDVSAKGIGDWSTTNVNSTGSSVAMDNTNNGSLIPNQTNGSTWVSGVNYVLFQTIIANNLGQITMTEHAITPNLTDARIGFSGFQLISVPEPSSAMLGGLGLLALLRRRRA